MTDSASESSIGRFGYAKSTGEGSPKKDFVAQRKRKESGRFSLVPGNIRKHILITLLNHAEHGGVSDGEALMRCRALFDCETIIVRTEPHQGG